MVKSKMGKVLEMNILIVPDSYKGTLSSQQVCDCIKNSIEEVDKNHNILCMPFADGGEGFGKCLSKICKGTALYTDCTDIYSSRIKAGIYTYGDTAVIECAAASGLQAKKNVMNATSYGTGELIKYAVSKGFGNIILGLGGSGCCDGGAGALSALGAVFKDENGVVIPCPKGKDIEKIRSMDLTNSVKHINFTYACDVENELYGENGAAFIFAKQKGATNEDIIHLDNGLKILNSLFPKNVSNVKGGGAAGGLCAGLYAVYGGEIKSGFDILSDAYKLEEKIEQANLVITGEGKTDTQTLMGKLPYKVYEIAKRHGKKCVVISGSIEGVDFADEMISLTDDETDIGEAMANAAETLILKSKNILKYLR